MSYEAPPKLIFASAEEVTEKNFHRVLKDQNSALNKQLELIVVDESHTIETWTGARDTKGTKVFRSAYGELSMLRSLCKQGE
ncbi:hypothetical protein QZH41_017771 [Actinostola sp. cb2023]|nr:hypothetical protein QZH41_017771 [Actinostola sp. cb2023]